MTSYELSKAWFDWSFENPELINPNHSAIFFFAIEHCNRLGWKVKFGFPTQMCMDAIGIKKHDTYIKYFNNLVDWDFFKLHQKSVNQYSSNIISLNTGRPKKGSALGKAIRTHGGKQRDGIGESNPESNGSIIKPNNLEPNNNITDVFSFEEFWSQYPKKTAKVKCEQKWSKLTDVEKTEIKNTLQAFLEYKPFPEYNHPNPETYLNQKRWQDELPKIQTSTLKPFKFNGAATN